MTEIKLKTSNGEFEDLFDPALQSGAANHNTIYRGKDITSIFDNGQYSANVSDGSFDDVFLGDYVQKDVTIDGTTYATKAIIADCDTFYGYDSGYAIVGEHHCAAIVTGLPNHRMNSTDTTEGGYAATEMQSWLENTVLPALEAAYGAEHLLAHKLMLSSAVNSSATNNRFGDGTKLGASSGWAWTDSAKKICLMSESQIGYSAWSSSGFDTGEAYKKLSLFNFKNPNESFGNIWFWLRDVASATHFCYVATSGHAGYLLASNVRGVRPLILLK